MKASIILLYDFQTLRMNITKIYQIRTLQFFYQGNMDKRAYVYCALCAGLNPWTNFFSQLVVNDWNRLPMMLFSIFTR